MNQKRRKYWVVESNDPEYPVYSEVRRDKVNELMGEKYQYRALISSGYGRSPLRAVTIWGKIVEYIRGEVNNEFKKITNRTLEESKKPKYIRGIF